MDSANKHDKPYNKDNRSSSLATPLPLGIIADSALNECSINF